MTTMLSQTRKFGLFLVMCHQNWSQVSSQLKGSMQNVGVELVFELGRYDAEYTARIIGSVDPAKIKYEVPDRQKMFDPLGEQWEAQTQELVDLPQRTFALKVRGKPVQRGKAIDITPPAIDSAELAEVEREYLHRYFTPRQQLEVQLSQELTAPVQPVSISLADWEPDATNTVP